MFVSIGLILIKDVKLETIPYNLRPHEIEAYSKDEELCKRIRELKEFNEIVKNISDAIRNIKEIIALMMMIHSRTQS